MCTRSFDGIKTIHDWVQGRELFKKLTHSSGTFLINWRETPYFEGGLSGEGKFWGSGKEVKKNL